MGSLNVTSTNDSSSTDWSGTPTSRVDDPSNWYSFLIFLAGILAFVLIFKLLDCCAGERATSHNDATTTDENEGRRKQKRENREKAIREALVIKKAQQYQSSHFSNAASATSDTCERGIHRSNSTNRIERRISSYIHFLEDDGHDKKLQNDVIFDIPTNQDTPQSRFGCDMSVTLDNDMAATLDNDMAATLDNTQEVDDQAITFTTDNYFCSICIEPFKVGEEGAWSKYLTSCPHIFHPECITSWLCHSSKKSGCLKTHDSCPNCRGYFFKSSAAIFAGTTGTACTEVQGNDCNDEAGPQTHDQHLSCIRNGVGDPVGKSGIELNDISLASNQEQARAELLFCVEHGLVSPSLLQTA